MNHPIETLLSEMEPFLKREKFRREADTQVVDGKHSFHFVTFVRLKKGHDERFDFQCEKPKRNGDFDFYVNCGIEFHEFERELFSIGMPCTHANDRLNGWVPQAPAIMRVTKSTDHASMAIDLSAWISQAFQTIRKQLGSLRKEHEEGLQEQEQRFRERLAFHAKKKSSLQGNVCRMAQEMLDQKTGSLAVLNTKIADDAECRRSFALHQKLLEKAICKSVKAEPSQYDHFAVSDVVHLVWWKFGFRKLFLAATRKSNGDYSLRLGCLAPPRSPSRPKSGRDAPEKNGCVGPVPPAAPSEGEAAGGTGPTQLQRVQSEGLLPAKYPFEC